MIKEPLTNKPKITQVDIIQGYVMRYFVKSISLSKVVEVDKSQYTIFNQNPMYVCVSLKWVIGGNDMDITTKDNQIYKGAESRNTASIDFYNRKLPGLVDVLRNPLEYFSGIKITT